MELFAADGHDAGGCERVTGKSGMRPHVDAHLGACRVAEREGDIVGFCVTKGPLVEVLMVAPAHQRRGIGRVLLADAEAGR